MKEFRDVYYFHVMDTIKRGGQVFCTDRMIGATTNCNGMIVSDLIELLSAAEDDNMNRFQFYTYVIKEDAEAGKENHDEESSDS